jgi:hypothetical protein
MPGRDLRRVCCPYCAKKIHKNSLERHIQRMHELKSSSGSSFSEMNPPSADVEMENMHHDHDHDANNNVRHPIEVPI